MKKVYLLPVILILFLFSCSANKFVVDNDQILKDHKAPYTVFGVGLWKPGYSVLTLTDATHGYFTIKTLNIDSIKIGSEYRP